MSVKSPQKIKNCFSKPNFNLHVTVIFSDSSGTVTAISAEIMSKIVFCTFGDKKWEKDVRRIYRQAKNFNLFDEFYIYNENNDITIDIIPPNIVARKSSLLNSESHISLTNPHRTETFVPMIE